MDEDLRLYLEAMEGRLASHFTDQSIEIAKLGTKIEASRAETSALVERLRTSVDGMQRVLLKHGTRLDDLEKRTPPGA